MGPKGGHMGEENALSFFLLNSGLEPWNKDRLPGEKQAGITSIHFTGHMEEAHERFQIQPL